MSVNSTLEKYLEVIKSILESRIVVDRFGNIVSSNQSVADMFGYKEDELSGKPIELLVSISPELHKTYRDKYLRHPYPKVLASDMTLNAKKKDGTLFSTSIILTPIFVPDLYVIVAIRDTSRIKQLHDDALTGWAKLLAFKDRETKKHTDRVAEKTVKFCRLLGFDEGELLHVWRGSVLHDIGKIGVPDYILTKPSRLTDDEFAIIKQHPVLAREMIVEIPFLKHAVHIPYCHHEKWDGTGYPNGLIGAHIPLEARAFTIIDVYDALSNNRSYRTAWDEEKIIEYIKEHSGKIFDPVLVEFFLKHFDSIMKSENLNNGGKIDAS